MLGDPGILMLDEPVNGLDPEGIVWVRNLLKHLAVQGRSIFVSSHLMSEMALTADHVVVIGRGRLIADTSIAQFISGSSQVEVLVRSPQSQTLCGLLVDAGAEVVAGAGGAWRVRGLTSARIGDLAAEHRVALHELTPQQASLEEVFMRLTQDSLEFAAEEVPAP